MCARQPARASRRPRACSIRSSRRSASTIPPDQLDNIVDNIGLPFSGINMAYQNTGTIGPEDGDALISLKEDHASDRRLTSRSCAPLCRSNFPGTTFSFLPADIVSQILNFGLPAPIDVQVIGNNQEGQLRLCHRICLKRIRQVPGIADLRIQQVFNYPQINVDVDRTLAGEVGLTQRDVANSLLVTLSGQRPGEAQFLAQHRERRVLSDRRADAAIPHRQHLGPVNMPVTSAGTQPRRNIWAVSRTSPRARARASSRTTTCSR